jgi:NADH dehydrogenase FAD-containing subunit
MRVVILGAGFGGLELASLLSLEFGQEAAGSGGEASHDRQ